MVTVPKTAFLFFVGRPAIVMMPPGERTVRGITWNLGVLARSARSYENLGVLVPSVHVGRPKLKLELLCVPAFNVVHL